MDFDRTTRTRKLVESGATSLKSPRGSVEESVSPRPDLLERPDHISSNAGPRKAEAGFGDYGSKRL